MAIPIQVLAQKLLQAAALHPGERLFGVVDGAQDLELALEAHRNFGQEIKSLFEGFMAEGAADVAPYMVPIEPKSGYLENWARRWGKNAGILMLSTVDAHQLHAHLRQIFVARDDEGHEYFFRFYDPRVLRGYFPTTNPEERVFFWKGIRAIMLENAAADRILRYSFTANQLSCESVPLGEANNCLVKSEGP